MNRNPYAAPEARVADPIEGLLERPAQVTYAVWLLWTSLAIALISTLLNLTDLTALMVLSVTALVIAAEMLFFAWTTFKIATGRNWARWLLLLMTTAIGLPSILMVPSAILVAWHHSPLLGTLRMLSWVAQWVALGLLFTPRAGAWFKANRSP